MKKLFSQVATGAVTLLLTTPVWALKISEAANSGSGELEASSGFILKFFMLVGIIMVGAGLMKLKAHKENPQQTPLSTPLTMIGIGGALAVVLGIMTFTGDSLGLNNAGDSLKVESTSSLFSN